MTASELYKYYVYPCNSFDLLDYCNGHCKICFLMTKICEEIMCGNGEIR